MSNLVKKISSAIGLTALILYGCFISPELHNSYLRYEVGESVVRVLSMSSDGGGTGFAVKAESGKEYIMTNKHVCEAGANGVIRVKVGQNAPVYRKIVHRDNIHDLCLIEGVKGLAPISIGSEPGEGDFHYVIGHPGLRDLTVQKGEYIGRATVDLLDDVLRREDCVGQVYELPPIYQIFMQREFVCVRSYRSYAISSVVYGGNSGSPIVNKWGNLIAVVFAGNPQQAHDNYAVPLSHVKRILARY